MLRNALISAALCAPLSALAQSVPPPNTPNLPTKDGALLAAWTQFVAGEALAGRNTGIELRYVLRGDGAATKCADLSVEEDGADRGATYLRGEMTEANPDKAQPGDYAAQVCAVLLDASTQSVTLTQGGQVAQIYNGAGAPVPAQDLPGPARLGARVPGQITGIALGDSGCRGAGEGQDCQSDWVLPELAAAAAAEAPDFVLHVGDYHYFYEKDQTFWGPGHGGNRIGYFLQEILVPAGPLLRAAPWIMGRGNHERCSSEWVGNGYHTLFGPRNYRSTDPCLAATPPSQTAGVPATWAVDLGAADGATGDFRFYVIDNVNAGAFAQQGYDAAAAVPAPQDGALTGWISHYPPMKMAQWSGRWHYGEDKVQAAITSAFGAAKSPCVQGEACLPSIVFSGHQHFYQEFTFDTPGVPVIAIVGHGGVGISADQQPGYTKGVLASTCRRGFGAHMPFAGAGDATLRTAQYHGYMVLTRTAATTDRTGWDRKLKWIGAPDPLVFQDIGECPFN